ncbi:Ribonuclease HIII|uniref:ribonuclease HIII n=1 Tax=Neochlamydia sp. AcF84 TaxID=2315858 RepID=UPI0014083011|nr:ribonuclease HIII [Neochlamydia sp. AcF84]NGY95956.1 Ribonuclease HIII [Neochlamydia sp. AcF84]
MIDSSPAGKPTNFVTTLDIKIADKLMQDLINQGFEITKPLYTLFSAKKKGISCTLYQSGKLMVQGKEMASFMEFYLEPHILGNFKFSYAHLEIDITARIGIDESGKGDFFGPLCIAGVQAEGQAIHHLKTLGVKDSKSLSDQSIIKIGNKIRTEYAHHIVKINPAKYNELMIQFKNLNHLLAWGHATSIEQLANRTGCQNVIIDQFADERVVIRALQRKKMEINLTQRYRGEEDLVVAAASILARQTFVEALDQLSEKYKIEFPKGASMKTIQIGKKLVQTYGSEVLEHVAKLHFKTLDAIMKN